jgi:hypothetical protein
MMPAMRAVLCCLAAALPAAEPLVLAGNGAWDLDWDPLLAAGAEPDLVVGGTILRPAEAGWWGGAALSGSLAETGGDRAWVARRPGHDGAAASLRLGGAVGALSIDLRPEWRWADDPAIAGQEDDGELVAAGSAVLHLPFDLAAVASTEPVVWGPGIFGNLLLSGGDRGFAHARLVTALPWSGLELLGDPVFLHAEGLAGELDRDDGLLDGPGLAGARVAARWRWLGAAASRIWHADWGDKTADPGQVRTSLELVVDPGRFRFGGAVGADPLVAPDGPDPLPLILVLDAYDLAGDGTCRLAFEWHHAMAAGGADSAYQRSWTEAPGTPAAGSGDVLRGLWSHRPEDEDWRYDLSPSWLLDRPDSGLERERIRLDARVAVLAGPLTVEVGGWGAWWWQRDEAGEDDWDFGAETALTWDF